MANINHIKNVGVKKENMLVLERISDDKITKQYEKEKFMKSLIVDDDFFSRRILQSILSTYGECHVAVDGKEALFAFKQAINEESPYDVICLDIMMPKMDGQEVLKNIRAIEESKNILGSDSVKIIMTTALDDGDSIIKAFREQCESYLIKPISKSKLLKVLQDFGLVE